MPRQRLPMDPMQPLHYHLQRNQEVDVQADVEPVVEPVVEAEVEVEPVAEHVEPVVEQLEAQLSKLSDVPAVEQLEQLVECELRRQLHHSYSQHASISSLRPLHKQWSHATKSPTPRECRGVVTQPPLQPDHGNRVGVCR